MIIIPAIDLLEGKVVRLKQGKYNQKTVYNDDPLAQAKKFVMQGAKYLHIVDLDGAHEGQMKNLEVILRIAKLAETIHELSLQVGGGIRSLKQIEFLLKRGVKRVILGTRAIEELGFLARTLRKFGQERIVVSLDVKDGLVMVKGWRFVETKHASSLLRLFQSAGLKYLIYTDIKKDGMMSSPNFPAIKNLRKYRFNLIVSGGISSLNDVKKLKQMEVYGCVVGRAVYEDDKFLEQVFSL
jgi:phosphoribosylformimino-5-aminoimidazole carboxamide ribotide isomerase